MVFQDLGLWPNLTAIQNVLLGLSGLVLAKKERRERAFAALASCEIAELADKRPHSLSGGEQQRVALARAWALQPQILFLDEPTASLDPNAAQEVERIIADIHAAGTTIVMSTHNLGQARRLADTIVFLHNGRVAEHTPAAAFFQQPRSAEAVNFLKGELP